METLFIFYLRTARSKARAAAEEEALSLLRDLGASAPPGGPLSERGGLFWIVVPDEAAPRAIARFGRLGYTVAVDRLEPPHEEEIGGGTAPTMRGDPVPSASRRVEGCPIPSDEYGVPARPVRWRRRPYHLIRVYGEDAVTVREGAPDRRAFLLETGDGVVRSIVGYRGDGGPLSRRALPVCDARLLVNLASPQPGDLLLDPFAGAGGVVVEALAAGCRVASVDIDPSLRHGLAHLGAVHTVADAGRLPFPAAAFDAIATEPPYAPGADSLMAAALAEMCRVLKPGGRIAVLCAVRQADVLRMQAGKLNLVPRLDTPINRKGLDVVVLVWERAGDGMSIHDIA